MKTHHLVRPWIVGVLVVGLLAAAACVRLGMKHARSEKRAPVVRAPVAGLGPDQLVLPQSTPSAHRLLLDGPALARLRQAAQAKTPAFGHVLARAGEAREKAVPSGYQGFEWADAVANLALAWHATGDVSYAEAALRYYAALLDDRLEVGDKKGGDGVVRYDSGYGIRTFGAYTALGYDWLKGAPGFHAPLRQKAIARLTSWLDWYKKEGYLRDRPIANYYWGYLTTLSFAGLALAGETPAADAWLSLAREELAKRALPALRDELRGGGWPEGFQYGEYTTAEIALVTEAFRTAAGIEMVRHVPWLGDTVRHHAHALLPDGRSVYDGGTWGEHPAQPSSLALAGAAVALEPVGDPRALEARWLTAHALPPLRREQAWIGLLAERPGAAERSPRDGATSLHLVGQGLTFARSDWTPSATWVSFQAGPWLAEDHQDADQGHFELFRGGDGLLVDGGDSEGSATINHNTLLIDDGGRHLNYPPNQGVWGGDRVKTTRFGDDGAVVVAVGEIGEAYAPSCAEDGCKARSVERATRSFVYVRPSLLVIDDRVELERADDGVTWALHLTRAPSLDGDLASAVVGSSRVDVRTLEPRSALRTAPREPTPSGEGSHRANKPWGPMWRLEVQSPRGERRRGFLHVVSAGASDARPPAARALSGEGFRGARVDGDGRSTVVILANSDDSLRVPLGAPADTLVVLNLTPGREYRVAVEPGCVLSVAKADGGDARRAGPGGFLRTSATGCTP